MIARSSNNYGPQQGQEKLIPRLIKHALNDEKLPLYGTGSQIRDWIHVDDCAQGLITVFKKARPGTIHHLSSETERTNLGIARAILNTLGKPLSLISHLQDCPGDDLRHALDASQTRLLLNWKARIPFRIGFKETVQEIASRMKIDQQAKSSPPHPSPSTVWPVLPKSHGA